MPDMDRFQETYEQLAEIYPERCRKYGPCNMLSMKLTKMVLSVSSGSLSIEKARELAADDSAIVSEHCVLGQTALDSEPPYPLCNYGVVEGPPSQ
ncbi:MAG: hypothetical protein WC498_01480 [Candidatus Saccharimonadales bacterium]